MPKHRQKKFYAVTHGATHLSPGIFSSWATTNALVTGVKKNKHKGFYTLQEAKDHMKANGIEDYVEIYDASPGDGCEQVSHSVFYYAVAHGKGKGVYTCYYNGAAVHVIGQQHACHKRFVSRKEAETFIKEWNSAISLRTQPEVESLSNDLGQLRIDT